MTSHAIAPIPLVANYFGDSAATPLVVEEFKLGLGWRLSSWRKRISGAYARSLRAEGVTHVRLEHKGRIADFAIDELLRSARRGA